MRIVHGLLRLAFRGACADAYSGTDCFDFIEILKSGMLELDQPAADDEMSNGLCAVPKMKHPLVC